MTAGTITKKVVLTKFILCQTKAPPKYLCFPVLRVIEKIHIKCCLSNKATAHEWQMCKFVHASVWKLCSTPCTYSNGCTSTQRNVYPTFRWYTIVHINITHRLPRDFTSSGMKYLFTLSIVNPSHRPDGCPTYRTSVRVPSLYSVTNCNNHSSSAKIGLLKSTLLGKKRLGPKKEYKKQSTK